MIIDRSVKTAWAVRKAAIKPQTPSLARRVELLGTIALPWKRLRLSYLLFVGRNRSIHDR